MPALPPPPAASPSTPPRPQIGVAYKAPDGSLLASMPEDLELLEACEVRRWRACLPACLPGSLAGSLAGWLPGWIARSLPGAERLLLTRGCARQRSNDCTTLGHRSAPPCTATQQPIPASHTATAASPPPAQVVYETLPGWKQDISKCRRWEDLPENARK